MSNRLTPRRGPRLPKYTADPDDELGPPAWDSIGVGFGWPVYRMVIAAEPPWVWRRAPEFQRPLLPGGVFVWGGERPGQGDPEPVAGRYGYNPVAEADAFLRAATAVDARSAESLTGFVNRWGLLSVGLQGNPDRGERWDSVWATARALEDVQRHVRWLEALQRGRWNSPDLPSLVEARTLAARVARGVPERPEQRDYRKVHWLAFAGSMRWRLRGVQPAFRWTHQFARPGPGWTAARPIHVLWATVWDWATGGASVRRCPHCGGWFLRKRANQRFCSRRCSSNASVARWRQRRGRTKVGRGSRR